MNSPHWFIGFVWISGNRHSSRGQAYRGKPVESCRNKDSPKTSGWTTEEKIITGPRITADQLRKFVDEQTAALEQGATPNRTVFVATCSSACEFNGMQLRADEIVGCIKVERESDSNPPAADIGLFAVDPELQGAGLGKLLLQRAEQFAIESIQAKSLMMYVVNVRDELQKWYGKFGYEPTGLEFPFANLDNPNVPLIDGIAFKQLKKTVG